MRSKLYAQSSWLRRTWTHRLCSGHVALRRGETWSRARRTFAKSLMAFNKENSRMLMKFWHQVILWTTYKEPHVGLVMHSIVYVCVCAIFLLRKKLLLCHMQRKNSQAWDEMSPVDNQFSSNWWQVLPRCLTRLLPSNDPLNLLVSIKSLWPELRVFAWLVLNKERRKCTKLQSTMFTLLSIVLSTYRFWHLYSQNLCRMKV